jgi:hypothetical protein
VLAVAVNYAAGRSPTGRPILAEVSEWLSSGIGKIAAVLERAVDKLAAGDPAPPAVEV